MFSLKMLLTKILQSLITINTNITTLQTAVTATEIDATVNSSISSANTQTCHLVKKGNTVRMYIGVGYHDGTTYLGRNTTLFTIPEGYRPSSIIRFPVSMWRASGTMIAGRISISSDGAVMQITSTDATAIIGSAEWTV